MKKNPATRSFDRDSELTLFPKLVASVGLDWLSTSDLELLDRLAENAGEERETVEPPHSQISRHGSSSYLLSDTGCHFSEEVRGRILDRWQLLGASGNLVAIVRAAQRQLIEKILFEEDGMVVEPRQPACIGKIGRKKLGKKAVRRLLKSLKISHEHYWPLEQTANIVEAYARKTRRRGGKKSQDERRVDGRL